MFKGLPIKYTFSDLKALEDLKEAVNQNRDSNIDILSLEHLGTFQRGMKSKSRCQ